MPVYKCEWCRSLVRTEDDHDCRERERKAAIAQAKIDAANAKPSIALTSWGAPRV